MVTCDFTQGSKVMAYPYMRLELSRSQLGKVELVPTYLFLLLLLHAEERCPGDCPPTYTVPEDGDTRLEKWYPESSLRLPKETCAQLEGGDPRGRQLRVCLDWIQVEDQLQATTRQNTQGNRPFLIPDTTVKALRGT
jgi:hypothetical protein